MKKIFYTLVALTTLFACQQEVGLEEIPGSTIREFTASSENGTKTTLSGLDVVWDVHDPVTIFCGTTKWNERAFYRVKDGCEGSVTTTLVSTGESPIYQDMPLNVGVYGEVYGEDLNYSSIGSSYHILAQLYFPSTRSYCANSFAPGDMPMFAVGDINSNSLSFKNLMGALELKFKGDGIVVKSISITGNNNEQISGVVSISSDGSIPGMEFSHGLVPNEKIVVLDCGAGVTLNMETPTYFYITIPPVTFSNGMTVEIETENGIITKKTTKTLSIARNSIKPMAEMTLVDVEPANVIYYTAEDSLQSLMQDRNKYDFGANLVSHTYENGQYVATFDGNVTTIPANVFCDEHIYSIILPRTVTAIKGGAFEESSLSEITFSENLTEIGHYAFAETPISSIALPNSVTTIGSYAFAKTRISSIVLPNSVTTIGSYAFAETALTQVHIPESVTSICSAAFRGQNLSTFTGKYASSDNKCLVVNDTVVATATRNMTSYVIPDGVQSIADGVFYNCVLREVELPSTLKSIGAAFMECTLSVICHATTPPSITINTFKGYDNTIRSIKVPMGSLAAYKSAWSRLSSYIQGFVEDVDLGLSVKWATCNLGANSEEEYGNYYSWGEVTTKSIYNNDNYSYGSAYVDSISPDKYTNSDGLVVLQSVDDAATAAYGSPWRTPTEAEWNELIQNCDWEWDTVNGIKGARGTSKKAGYTSQSIFLPLAGFWDNYYEGGLAYVGECGQYLSSSLYTNNKTCNYEVYMYYSGGIQVLPRVSYLARYKGQSLRAVR